MKKYITPISIAMFLWGLILITISEVYRDYTRYFLYLSIIIVIPLIIVNMIKQRKEDKINNTKEFQASIYRMLIMAVMLAVFFFMTKQYYV
jgi:predicted Na+-dependent transporter